MDAKHLIAIDGTDDGYDWQLAPGTGAVRDRPRVAKFAPSGTQNGDKGIEADNTETSPYTQLICAGRSFCQLVWGARWSCPESAERRSLFIL